MEWLVILGLGAWVWLQSRRIRTLTLELTELRRAVARPPAPAAMGEDEPLLLTEVVRDDELLLDAPLPAAANDATAALEPFAWPAPPSVSEAAATLALALTLLAPALADLSGWAPGLVTALVGAAAAAGFAVAGWRRWPWLAVTTLTGLYVWFAFALGGGDVLRAITLLALAGIGGAAMALRPPRNGDATAFGWGQVHAALPAIAIVAGSVLSIWTWFDTSPTGVGLVQAPTVLATGLCILAALAVRAGAAAPLTFAVSVSTLIIGFMAHLNVREGALSPAFYPLILTAAFVLAAAAYLARPTRETDALVAGAGAAGASLLALLAAFSRLDWHGFTAFAPLFGVAALMCALAWLSARHAADAQGDAVVDIWMSAGAALALLGIESAFAESARVLAHAGLSLVLTAAYARLGWRALRFAALIAAAFALGHAMSPTLFRLAGDGLITLLAALAILAGAGALLFGASRLAARRGEHDATPEALAFAAWLTPVLGAFYVLHWLSLENMVDALVANALRTLVLLGAGLALLPRKDAAFGDVARWRGHALLIAGIAFSAFWGGFALNPWWGGADAAPIAGPILFNAQAITFLAPASLALYAAGRVYARELEPARLYAAAGAGFGLMWAALEIRRTFRGDQMAQPAIGVFEASMYALLFIGAALIIALAARVRASKDPERPFTRDLLTIMRPVTCVALAAALILMLGFRHPWWGAQDAPLTGDSATGWAVVSQAAALALSLWLARVLSISRPAEPARFAAAAAAALFALSLGVAGVRWLYHRGAMDDGVALHGLEGLAYAVWPLLLVSAAAYFTARAPGRDAERAYLYDLQAIWAAAIWPAMGFAALGLWGLFNPWWGVWPVRASNLGGFLTILAGFGLAACLSAVAARIPHVHARRWLARGGVAMGAAHLSIAAIMLTRRLFHHETMSAAPALDSELWTYVAVWVACAIAAFAIGTQRGNMGLRWYGIGLTGLSIAYAFALAFTRLSGGAQVGAILAIALTPFVAVWAVRAFKPPARLLRESDLRDITPSARRERRHGRRYRSP